MNLRGKEFEFLQKEMLDLNIKYNRVRQEIGWLNKIEWTMDVIRQLHESKLGSPERLSVIKKTLEESNSLSKQDTDYLKEKYVELRSISPDKDKTRWTLEIIQQLLRYEIGNPGRLNVIRRALEDGKPVDPIEIDYLKEKFAQLTILKSNKSDVEI